MRSFAISFLESGRFRSRGVQGGPVHFFFFTVCAAAVSAPSPCTIPAARADGAHHFAAVTPVPVVIAGHRQRGQLGETHPAHLPPYLFGDGNGATRGSLEALHAGRVIPDQLVRRAKTGTSG